MDSWVVYFACFLNLSLPFLSFCFLSQFQFFPVELSWGMVQHLLLLICLSRAGMEDWDQQGRGHGARGLGCLKMLLLALMPWKRSLQDWLMLAASPWPEVGTDGISCSMCGPGPHCLESAMDGLVRINGAHRK